MRVQRNQLVWLRSAAWLRWLSEASQAERAVLRHWRDHALPLVVARPPSPLAEKSLVALGLPAPQRFGRRRIALVAHGDEVERCGPFPPLDELARHHGWPAGEALAHGLSQLHIPCEVYGSHGWQWLTGEAYLHAGSDLDLSLRLPTLEVAGAAVALLRAAVLPPRLDGELVLPDGRAIAWREWAALQEGRVQQVLVKSLRGVQLCDAAALQAVVA